MTKKLKEALAQSEEQVRLLEVTLAQSHTGRNRAYEELAKTTRERNEYLRLLNKAVLLINEMQSPSTIRSVVVAYLQLAIHEIGRPDAVVSHQQNEGPADGK